MKRMMRLLALCLAVMLLGGCGASMETQDPVRLFAVNVGKGDALLLRVGEYTCLIDTARTRAMGCVRTALERLGVERLDAVFITHTDDDHTGGLEWLAEAIPVDAWYASALYTGVKSEEKHPVVKAAAACGQSVHWLRRGDVVPAGSGAQLRVLAPISQYDDEDDNSLVMMLESPQGRILLTGDMELPEEQELLSQGDDLSCAVLKVGNHGDDDTTSHELARAAGAQIAVISTDSQEKPGTPDAGVVSRLESAGSKVLVTQDSGFGLYVELSGGVATARAVDIDTAPVEGLSISGLDVDDDRVTIVNRSGAPIDLDGFYLYSEKGDKLFVFPDGANIAAGGTLTVGARSSDGDYDLLWDDKKVISKKKTDAICLYDPCGRRLDRVENGL